MMQAFQWSRRDSRHLGQSHITIISRSEIIWEDLEILHILLSNSSCSHWAPKAHAIQPNTSIESRKLYPCQFEESPLLACYSIMIIISFAELDSSLWGLLGSISKCWLPFSKQSIMGCLRCHWSMDPVSGLIAWPSASLPQQREAG